MLYTKGKWLLDTENSGVHKVGMMENFRCAIKSEPDSYGDEWFIALVHSGAGSHSLEGETESLANAKLITAAPLLLEVLQTLQANLAYATKNNAVYTISKRDIDLIDSTIMNAI